MTEWLWPRSLAEALDLRSVHGDEALPVAGGTFVGVVAQMGFLELPEHVIGLGPDRRARRHRGRGRRARDRRDLDPRVDRTERAPCGPDGRPSRTVSREVANIRIRNVATVGGVLADADYASDPPAMLLALDASVEIASLRGTRTLAIDDLILGHYTTALEPDELITGVRDPAAGRRRVREVPVPLVRGPALRGCRRRAHARRRHAHRGRRRRRPAAT